MGELASAWNQFNRTIFGRSLSAPGFELHSGRSKLGSWDRTTRTISLSEELVFGETWLKTLAVLKHEMLHQFIDESMGGSPDGPHGSMFRALRQRFGIEEYEEVALGSSDEASRGIMAKVQKLLALAQSEEVHEAEAAMAKANALMLKWNIDHRGLERERQVRHLGRPTRIYLHLKMLGTLLRDFFFVEAIWVESYDPLNAKRGRVLEVMGRPENVEMAEYVFHYLLNVGEMHWKEHRREQGGGKRANYLFGLISGFYDKCRGERHHQEQEGLIWTGEAWLEAFLKERHPRTRTVRSSGSRIDAGSYEAGRKKGSSMVIHRGVHGRGKGGGFLDKT